jgi:flagellar operon protein
MSRIENNKISELLQQQQVQQPTSTQTPAASGPDFGTILQDQLKISGHAQTRLQSRNIELGQDQWQRVLDGVNKAADKGAKESLVMVDDVALVVSVKNRTVITAVDKSSLKNNVFTNIDSAVVV